MADNNNQDSDDLSQRKMIYDHFFNESERISHRTDWFLIFHAILIETFINLEKTSLILILIVSIFGTLISYIWFFVGFRSWWVLWQLGAKMEIQPTLGDVTKKMFAERQNSAPRFHSWARPSDLFSIVTPAISFFVWISLAVAGMRTNPTYLYWFFSLLFGICLIIVLILPFKKPKIFDDIIANENSSKPMN